MENNPLLNETPFLHTSEKYKQQIETTATLKKVPPVATGRREIWGGGGVTGEEQSRQDRDGITVQTRDPKQSAEGKRNQTKDKAVQEEKREVHVQSTVRMRASVTVCWREVSQNKAVGGGPSGRKIRE